MDTGFRLLASDDALLLSSWATAAMAAVVMRAKNSGMAWRRIGLGGRRWVLRPEDLKLELTRRLP